MYVVLYSKWTVIVLENKPHKRVHIYESMLILNLIQSVTNVIHNSLLTIKDLDIPFFLSCLCKVSTKYPLYVITLCFTIHKSRSLFQKFILTWTQLVDRHYVTIVCFYMISYLIKHNYICVSRKYDISLSFCTHPFRLNFPHVYITSSSF